MYNIKTLNEISPVYAQVLDMQDYSVSSDCADPDAIIVRSADMHSTPKNNKLLAIGRAGAGYNNIPVTEMGKQGVVVFNAPGANANAVKELALAALLLASRDIVGGIEWCKTLVGKGADVPKLVEKGKNQFVGPELKGKTLGVIGLGGVGGLVANAGHALDMNVIGYDPYISVDHAWKLSRSIRHAKSQEELLADSDYVSVHVPLMDKTRGSLNAGFIAGMKKGAVLLNLSRGELAVNADVLSALQSGQLRRYVTDFPCEEMINQPGVIAIPHLGASTPESEDNCVRMVADQIDKYLRTGSIINSVNYPTCELPMPHNYRVVLLHANIPNMIGPYASMVASYGINIDNMVNKSKGEFAYTALDLDDMPPAELLEKLTSPEGSYGMRVIHA